MKTTKVSITLLILSLLFAFLLYYFSLWDSGISDINEYPIPFNTSLFNGVYKQCCKNKEIISLIAFAIIIFIHILLYFRGNNNKNWLQRFLQHIIDQNLGGAEYETRITIFCKKKGWRFIFPYLFHYIKCGNFRHAYKHRPKLFENYLVIFNRFSFPKQKKSYTFFRAITEENVVPTSIVEKCYKKGTEISISAPYISDIIFKNNMLELSLQDQIRVQGYMDKTGTSDYGKLCMLNRKANYIYAVPIRQDEEIWGVVVFDNNRQDNPVNIKDKLENVIFDYQKIIQFTIQIYK